MVVGTDHAMARQRSKKKKKHFVPAVAVCEGKCEELKAHTYNMVPGKNGFDIFAKTTTEIRQYIACTVPNAGEFTLVMQPDSLGFLDSAAPTPPTDPTDLIELEIWKAANKQYNDLLEKRDENKRQAYTIVWGQCSPTIQD
jgi:hypothetical protein